MKNNTQPIVIGLSFLVIGLVVGLLISSKGTTFIANFIEDEGSAQGPEAIVDQIMKEDKRVSVSMDDDSVLGSPDAPITIVEFSDYQCPYCNSFWSETFPQIKANYIDTGKARFVYRDYPLPSHPQAQLAAEAAECAAKDNSALYYQMHDKLFGGVAEWHLKDTAKDTFIAYGNDLGVDITTCLNNGEMSKEVSDDFVNARTYGVQATPTFFVNGLQITGAYPYEVFELLIERELES